MRPLECKKIYIYIYIYIFFFFFWPSYKYNFSKIVEQFSFHPSFSVTFFFLPIRLSQTMSNLLSDFLFFIYKLSLKMYLCSAKTGTKEIVKIHLVSFKNE